MPADNTDVFGGGAYTTLEHLISLRFAAREIALAPPARVRQRQAGVVASRMRGRGIDFAEVRRYEPGDDVRSIDWRVTARTGKPHTKLFQEDKERPVFLVLDQSSTMFFGSNRAFKSVAAAEVAALIAWSANEHGDCVGGIVFQGAAHWEIRPRRGKSAVLRLLGAAQNANVKLPTAEPAKGNDNPLGFLCSALEATRRAVREDALVVVISDFSTLDKRASTLLAQLGRSGELLAIRVADQLERELPPPNVYTITDGQARSRIDTGSAVARQGYAIAADKRLRTEDQVFTRSRAQVLELPTHTEPVAILGDQLRVLLGGRT